MKPEELDELVKQASNAIRDFFERHQAGTATEADDPRPELGSRLFEIWQVNRDVLGASRVLSAAFRMWGGLGSVEAVERALPHLDVGAGYWGSLIEPITSAYFRVDRISELLALLHRFQTELTHPKGLVALYSNLGRYYLWLAGEPERARAYYEKVLELTTDAVEVLWARGALYEVEFLQPGQLAPEVCSITMDGRSIRLSDFRGRVVCLAFWAPSCGPCWGEMSHLRAIRHEHTESELALIGIAKDRSLDRCREVADQEGLDWPHIWEPGPALQGPLKSADDYPDEDSIARTYNVWAIPRAFLIARDGRIISNHLRGERLVEAVRAAANAAVSGDNGTV